MRGLPLLCFLGFVLTESAYSSWPSGGQLPMGSAGDFNITSNYTMVNESSPTVSNAEWNGTRTNVDNSAGFPPTAEKKDIKKPRIWHPFSGGDVKPTDQVKKPRIWHPFSGGDVKPTDQVPQKPRIWHPFSGGDVKPTDEVPQVEQK
ncbi:hypothetical protein PBY51_014188 [Eleginops maclovinus]|uniref:Uncharacterized protein n=1 Tax=Eleginops maclovinus TaxID=56733 RepID=A0AAN7WYJ7_ELEMC|nr:hypothetical protein PBY51_014188 [Eleginops maclovinus]